MKNKIVKNKLNYEYGIIDINYEKMLKIERPAALVIAVERKR